MKTNYSSSIINDLTIIINTLNENGKKAQKTLASGTPLKMDINWSILRKESTGLLDKLNSFDDSFAFDISYVKKDYISYFYNNTIFYDIGSIKSGFDYQVSVGQENLEYYLNYFNVDDKVQELNNNLYNSYFIEKILNAKNNLVSDFSSLKYNILNEFVDFKTLLEDETTMYEIKGFEKNRRNLDESYNLTEIEDALNKIDKEYDNFKKNVTTSNIISEIITKKRGFITSLTNSASTLTYNFYAYQVLISQYTSYEKVEKYFTELENQALIIKQQVSSYINSHTNLIDNVLQTINNQMIITKTNINKGINDKINEALNYVYNNKFSNLINIDSNSTAPTNLNFNIGTIYYYDSKGEIIQTIDLTFNGIDVINTYKLMKKNNYDFFMDVNTYSIVNLNTTIKVGDFFIEEISGIVTHETIGVQADYNLHDRSLDVNAYVTPQSSTFKHSIKNVDQYGVPHVWNEFYESTPDTPLSMSKSYKKRIW